MCYETYNSGMSVTDFSFAWKWGVLTSFVLPSIVLPNQHVLLPTTRFATSGQDSNTRRDEEEVRGVRLDSYHLSVPASDDLPEILDPIQALLQVYPAGFRDVPKSSTCQNVNPIIILF